MADTTFPLPGDGVLLHKMAIPTSTFEWSAPFSSSLFPTSSTESLDLESPKKTLRLDNGEEQLFTSCDSLADGLLSQPLHDGVALQAPLRLRLGSLPAATKQTNASSTSDPLIVSLQDTHQAFNRDATGSLLPPGEMSFPSNGSHPTPEPALPAEDWGSSDFASIGQSTSINSDYASRQRSEEYSNSSPSPGLKRKRDSTGVQIAVPPNISDDQKLLLELRDEQNLPWKDIALKFQSELGRSDRVPALQMRYKRLKERLRVWTDTDVEALRQAYQFWETRRFEIISEKMLEFGVSEKWPARHCALKWQELSTNGDQHPSIFEGDVTGFPMASQTSSPGPQGLQPNYGGSLDGSSGFPSLSRSRPEFQSNLSALTSNPSGSRHGLEGFSPDKSATQFPPNTGVSQAPGAQSFLANYGMAGGRAQTMSPHQRVHSGSITSSPGLMGSQNMEVLTQPLYNSPSFPGLTQAPTATPPQSHSIPGHQYVHSPPSSNPATIPHQSSSYSQMNQQLATGYQPSDTYCQNRQSQYTGQPGGGAQYMDQQHRRR